MNSTECSIVWSRSMTAKLKTQGTTKTTRNVLMEKDSGNIQVRKEKERLCKRSNGN